jgi:hypothetical protein
LKAGKLLAWTAEKSVAMKAGSMVVELVELMAVKLADPMADELVVRLVDV